MVQALPAISVGRPFQGLVQTMSPEQLSQAMQTRDQEKAALAQQPSDDATSQLASYIRTQWDIMRRHRSTTAGWNDRLLKAQRTFKGEYDPAQLAEIKRFGGSDVYMRIIAQKCRGATALLREVYLGPERPWGVDPTPEPTLPDSISDAVQRLVQNEVQGLYQGGQKPDVTLIKDRMHTLMDAALAAAKKKAREEAVKAEDHLDTLLIEGRFYKALAELLTDIPLFPFGVIKGPVVKIVPTLRWENQQAVEELTPRMFWSRISPFDIYFTPGVSDIADADFCERSKITRKDLNDLMGLPGYDEGAIRQVLIDYGTGGLHDWLDPTDAERAYRENKENPTLNQSAMIDCLEFNGMVQGSVLADYGLSDQIDDPIRDYAVQAWLIGRHVIKVQLSPNPRRRHPYFVTSFEKSPGTVIGNALPDILEDIQQVCNAAARSLVNNLSISSGPQVVVNMDRLAPGEDGQQMFPWKRWFVTSDPLANSNSSQKPVDFFQPNSNAQELLGVYEKFTQIADELSAIPRYMSGSDRMGGAGRTASGLAMLMGNASKLLQTVAANIDRDIMEPLLQSLYEMVMLSDDSGILRGDEAIKVRGVDVAVQRETNRQRQLEFLQLTANPIDTQIMGTKGRAEVLRTVSHTIGIDGESVVPTDDELDAQAKAQQAAQAAQLGQQPGVTPPGNGNPAPAPGDHALGVDQANQSRAMSPTPGRIPQ